MKKNQKKIIVIVSILLLAVIVYFLINPKSNEDSAIIFNEPISHSEPNKLSESNKETQAETTIAPEKNTKDKITDNTITEKPKINDSVLIKMPFLVQAPFANWDALHEDACEESSLIMVYHYLNKTKIDSIEQGENEIKKMIDYETTNQYGPSITLYDLSVIAKKYYNMNSGRIIEANKEIILAELNAGKPVIAPAAGKLLQNPNFRNGGPNYHMLVIKGYDKNGFITNDPGTKKGEGFRYSFENLIYSIRDWNSDNILNGEKKVLVFD